MSRFVQVNTVKYQAIVVELKDDDPDDAAYEVVDGFDEATIEVLDGVSIESSIRHADEVHYLEDLK